MSLHLAFGTCLLVAVAACIITPGATQQEACATSTCGCYTKKNMVFTGQVMDAQTGECIPFKSVVLRDLDGTRVSEDRSRTNGTYRLEGEVQRSASCGGGEPTIRDTPDAGQSVPNFEYLPRRSPIDANSETVNLLRVPWGTTDAGTGQPLLCTPRQVPDGGM